MRQQSLLKITATTKAHYLEEAKKLRKKLESEKRKQSKQLKSCDFSDYCEAAIMLCM